MKTWRGEKQRGRARQTGTYVSVLDAYEAQLDPDGGRWYTLCEAHNQICQHTTLTLAKWHASDPMGWCEECRKLRDK